MSRFVCLEAEHSGDDTTSGSEDVQRSDQRRSSRDRSESGAGPSRPPPGPSRQERRREQRSSARAARRRRREDAALESMRRRNQFWLFTLNNPLPEEVSALREFVKTPLVRYAIWQSEVGQNGTPHLQGYFELRRARAFGTLHRMFPRLHLEARLGTRDQARDYCRKTDETAVPGTVEEYGKWEEGGRGARNDIEEVTAKLREGASVCRLVLDYPQFHARHPRFLQSYKQSLLALEKRSWLTKVVVLVGPTGVGKTRLAHHLWPEIWTLPCQDKGSTWFDSYEGHRAVLIDDFGPGELPFQFLLRLLDRHPVLVPVKGSFVNFIPYVVVITSNWPSKEWFYRDDPERAAPLFRRIYREYTVPLTPAELGELSAIARYGTDPEHALIRNDS